MRRRRAQSRAWPLIILGVAFGAAAPGAVAAPGDPAGALADPTIEWLDWVRGAGAESCAGSAAFAAAVAAQLGETPAGAARRSGLRLSIAIERGPGRAEHWSAELRLIAADGSVAGTRRLERDAGSCAALVDALALMASLILSDAPAPKEAQKATATAPRPAAAPPPPGTPPAGAAAPTTAPTMAPTMTSAEPPPPPPPAPEPPSLTPPPPGLAPPPRPDVAVAPAELQGPTVDLRPPRVTAEAGVAGGAGLLPRLTPGAEVRLALALAPVPTLFASGVIWRSQNALIAGSDTGSTLGLWLAGLGVCPIDRRWRSRALSACVGGEVGRLHASGIGFAQSFDQDRWATDVTAGAHLRQTLDGSGFYLALDVRLVVPLLRGRIVFGDASGAPGEIFRMWPVAPAGGLQVGYAFE